MWMWRELCEHIWHTLHKFNYIQSHMMWKKKIKKKKNNLLLYYISSSLKWNFSSNTHHDLWWFSKWIRKWVCCYMRIENSCDIWIFPAILDQIVQVVIYEKYTTKMRWYIHWNMFLYFWDDFVWEIWHFKS